MFCYTTFFRPLADIRCWLFLFLLLAINPHSFAQAILESPTQGSFESGISLIRGWVCDANQVEVSIDGEAPRQTAYGTKRGDTVSVCGDDNNGFGLTFNWNAVDNGIHNIRALADGVEFANVNFVVTTLGVNFLEGANGEFTLPDFPNPGSSPMVRWSQAQQNFVLSSAISVPNITNPPSNPRAFLESPTQGSSESGVGLIRGWVCEANTVEVVIDGGALRQTAYGTKRGDTIGVCGDDNNGFGLTFNWNAIGNGVHNLRALADGVEFANVNFAVTTLGVDFLEGASGQFPLPDFPSSGNITTVGWSEPSQNFNIVSSTVTGAKIATVAAVTDPNNPLLAAALGANGSNNLGVQVLKGPDGQPTQLTALTWADLNQNLFANLLLGNNGLPVSYQDSLGIEARFSNFTQSTFQISFVDAQGTVVLGPLTVPIDFGLLLPLQQLAATLQNPIQSSLIDAKQLQQRYVVSAARGPFSLDAVALDAIWAGGVAAGGVLCSLQSATGGTTVSNLIAAAGCGSPLISGFAELADAGSGSNPTVQSVLKFSEDVTEAPCDPNVDGGAGCLTTAAGELQEREPPTEPETPTAPTNVNASDGTFPDQINVTWSAVTNATSYEVYRSTSSSDNGSLRSTVNSTSFEDTSVSPGITYWYRVKACNSAGCSEFSSANNGFVQLEVTMPGIPTGVSASDGTFEDRVNISWNEVSEATFYEVARSDLGATTGTIIGSSSTTSFNDTTVSPDSPHEYRVRACNDAGCSEFSDPDQGFRAAMMVQEIQWGAVTDVCCTLSVLTFEVTIDDVLRRSTVAACPPDEPLPESSFEGFVTTTAGTKNVFATASGGCISQTFSGPLDFSAGTCYLMRLALDNGQVRLLQEPVSCASSATTSRALSGDRMQALDAPGNP
ncbi:MAG: hypothetical protein V2J55_00695 [Candidatus Competibacteraceae bacterium]|nr:hypothetical protein [Candidatus Competibacteraceae bacterium]